MEPACPVRARLQSDAEQASEGVRSTLTPGAATWSCREAPAFGTCRWMICSEDSMIVVFCVYVPGCAPVEV